MAALVSYEYNDDAPPLMVQLIAEAGLADATLTPGQRMRFAEVVEHLNPPPDLTVHPSVNSRAKRFVDVVGATAGLILLAIVGPLIAVAIRLTSKGPVFFKQTRCGVGGTPFVMWKFRTMIDVHQQECSDDGSRTGPGYGDKCASDSRITKVGRFLRATSLDEIPQFLNVLRGDMSLVGTRPPTPHEVSAYDRRQWDRLRVKTGLTGQWQVSGRSEIKHFEKVVDLDLAYQQQWSISHDLTLISRTIPAALGRKGAL